MSERVLGAIALAPVPQLSSLALDLSAGDGLSSRMLAERGVSQLVSVDLEGAVKLREAS